MNAIPDKSLRAEKQRNDAAAEAEGVRLTIDFDEDGPDQSAYPTPAGAADPWAEASPAQSASPVGMTGAPPDASGVAAGTRQPGPIPAARPAASAATPSEPPTSSQASAAPQPAGSARRKTAVPGMPAQLAGIEVTLSVEIGSHRLPLRDLLSVDPGQLFPLDRMTSEPVSILVNGRPFARGEVVAIGDRFGVRLLDMLGAEDEA